MEKEKVDTAQLMAKYGPQLRSSVKESTDFEVFKRDSVTMAFAYFDPENNLLLKVIVRPEDYN